MEESMFFLCCCLLLIIFVKGKNKTFKRLKHIPGKKYTEKSSPNNFVSAKLELTDLSG